jgi:hypothetical protein
MTQSVNFEEALTDNDYGLIISKDGELKGIFIPDTLEEEEVPTSIVKLCMEYFGIDIVADNEKVTVH